MRVGRSNLVLRVQTRSDRRRKMFQIRIHGRGGQGVVTAAELLSVAAFAEGRHAQAFPSFGSERMGAPVVSFCRIDDREIRTREPVMVPDALIIQDVTLLHQVDLFSGLSSEGYVLVNTSNSFDELGLGEFLRTFHSERLLTCPATEFALEHLGRTQRCWGDSRRLPPRLRSTPSIGRFGTDSKASSASATPRQQPRRSGT